MIKRIGAWLLALALFPASVFADVEMKGTVVKVDKAHKRLVVKTDRGEHTLLLGSSTKGAANAKAGAKVTVKFTEKDGQPRVTEIAPRKSGSSPIAPR